MATLKKQVWINQLCKNFYPDGSFLNFPKKFDSMVENDKLTLADVGVDPAVLIDNNTYPIAITERNDSPIEITLQLFETENTSVRNPEAVELSYDKVDSVIMGHKEALRATTAATAAHAYSPQANTTFTPVLVTTGADNGEGFKRCTIKDVLLLKRKFDDAEIPQEDRYLVLDPAHTEDLLLESAEIFKDMFDLVNGQPKKFAGFGMLQFSRNAKYNHVTKNKIPFGAVGANVTRSSFAFQANEVMRADGKSKMYIRKEDPEHRNTVIGFDKRFVALSFRNKGLGAIISAPVA